MNLASFYEASNQWSQAATVLQASEAQVGSSPMLSYRVGRALEHQQQWNDALRQYQKALQADSTFAPALAAVGHLYLLDRSKTQAAVDILARALALQPLPAVRLDLATALVRAGKSVDAIPHVEALMQADPSIATKIVAARTYVAADQLDKGLPMYEDVDVGLEAPANDLLAAGNALTKAKRYDEARGFYTKALEKDEKLHDVHYRLGVLDLFAKNYEAAIANFEKKLAADPKHASSAINLGNASLQLKKNAEALMWYRKATQMAPNSAATWNALGQALSADSTAAAQKAFDRALAVDPNNAAAKRGKAFTYLVVEQYAPAIKLLREATAADPEEPMGWVWLGQALLNSGNHAEARTAYQQALKLDPGNKEAQEGLQLLNGAASSR
jgi:tetratricopeptide (TPR) repeat protein